MPIFFEDCKSVLQTYEKVPGRNKCGTSYLNSKEWSEPQQEITEKIRENK